MKSLPARMTDAAYQKSVRDAEKQVANTTAEYQAAKKVLDDSSIGKNGFLKYLETWIKVRKLKGKIRVDQKTLDSLKDYKKE
jgi:hypothetical protein